MRLLTLTVLVVLLAVSAFAADHDSPESLLAALYQANSVEPGQKHDWERFRALFAPDARMMVRTKAGALRVLTVEEFIAASSQHEGEGFIERPIVTRMLRFEHIAHAWSSYEAFAGSGEGRKVIYGVNSFQMVQIGERWLLATILWEPAPAGSELPADLQRR